jgi:retinol dehydrogenase-12
MNFDDFEIRDWPRVVVDNAEVGSVFFAASVVAFLMFGWILLPVYSLIVFGGFLYAVSDIARRIARGGTCTYNPDLTGKTVIVTGANSGIGLVTTSRLANMGATVIMACRNPNKADSAVQQIYAEVSKTRGEMTAKQVISRIVVKELDLTSFESIRSFAQSIEVVDVLVNNGGIGFCDFSLIKPCKNATFAIEAQFLSNHLGHFLLTQLLLDKLKASEDPRIVVVSSLAHSSAKKVELYTDKAKYDRSQPYPSSKLANLLFARELHRKLNESGGSKIKVAAVHPGTIPTDFIKHIISPSTLRMINPIAQHFWKILPQCAETSVYCAIHPDVISGQYYSECKATVSTITGNNMKAAANLWVLSETLIQAAESGSPFTHIDREKKE